MIEGLNRESTDWKGVKAWVLNEIKDARDRLEVPEIDVIQTSTLRGEILALRKLLMAAEPYVPPEIVTHNYEG